MNQASAGLADTSRRRFIDFLLGTGLFMWLASLLYPIAKYLVPPKAAVLYVNSVEAGLLADFPLGSSRIIRFGRKPVIVVRQQNGNFSALSATCTHLSCTVQFKKDTEQIWCACHNGLYDLQGKNIAGPPPRPLAQYQVVLKDEKVIIALKEMA